VDRRACVGRGWPLASTADISDSLLTLWYLLLVIDRLADTKHPTLLSFFDGLQSKHRGWYPVLVHDLQLRLTLLSGAYTNVLR
jgi:hypothetical protein